MGPTIQRMAAIGELHLENRNINIGTASRKVFDNVFE